MKMKMITCSQCGQCNRKGKPSVMKGSAFCDSHVRSVRQVNRTGLFQRFKDFLYERRTRYDEKGEMKEFKKKGFRESWFWR